MGIRASEADEDLIRDAVGWRIIYHPHGCVKDLFTDKSEEILVAGPAGTGKSLGILQKCHLMLSKYPGSKGFMSRKTRTSMTNSCIATFNERVIKPMDKVHFHGANQVYNYPNGSEFAVIGLDDPERIKSTDWDFGYIQEVTECEENDWEICTTRLRHWVIPYQQMLGDCNPDKPTHWMKKRTEKIDEMTKQPLTKMLLSRHEDNPRLWDHRNRCWTKQGLAYLGKLMRLSGVRRERLYAGNWVAAEGVIYDNWTPQKHIINSVKDLPTGWEMWPHYWAIDWGYIHPFVWSDYIEDPITGNLYLYQQIYRTQRIVEDHAAQIMELTRGYQTPRAIICDHDAGDRATFERHTELLTLPAYKNISTGIQAVQKRLTRSLAGEDRGIFYLRDALIEVDPLLKDAGLPTCTIDEFDGYVWDKRANLVSNSKKDELPIDKDNHGMDETRYMVAFIDSLGDDPEDFEDTAIYEEEVHISSW